MPNIFQDYRKYFVGVNTKVPLLDGTTAPYVNLDNAASTPPLKFVTNTINSFLPYYSSVHRGTGYKSQLSTQAYEDARESLIHFVGGNINQHVCIFGKNTTEAVNKLANRFPFTEKRNTVLVSTMEHHSNDLPWRSTSKVIHIGVTSDGYLDIDDFDDKLAHYQNELALVAISGASNVTGLINPIHQLAEKAHSYGVPIFVDCAQLAPHRKINMRNLEDIGHIDFIAVSGHKMYAPFGTGALIGRKDYFEKGIPDMTGGGTIELVTLDNVVWAAPPERDEAGSPNVVGAVALHASVHELDHIGMDNVAQHEAELTTYALQELIKIPQIQLYGDTNSNNTKDRLGVIPWSIKGISHFKVAAILGYEFGIGVRSGCFCAHPYIINMLRLSNQETKQVRERMLNGDKSNMPGLIRISFGLYNSFEDIDRLILAIKSITSEKYKGDYVQDIHSGEYSPKGWEPSFDKFFSL